eukprot:10241327-Karenia_brevis.AAC.1
MSLATAQHSNSKEDEQMSSREMCARRNDEPSTVKTPTHNPLASCVPFYDCPSPTGHLRQLTCLQRPRGNQADLPAYAS